MTRPKYIAVNGKPVRIPRKASKYGAKRSRCLQGHSHPSKGEAARCDDFSRRGRQDRRTQRQGSRSMTHPHRETLEERAESWLKSVSNGSKEAAYCLRIIGTKARNAAKRAPAREKRLAHKQAVNKLRKAEGIKPTKTRKSLLRDADMWFSRFIRLRDSQTIGDGIKVCKCATCGLYRRIDVIDCGHWQRRENWDTRFDEMNTASQCRECNRYKGGKEIKFGEYVAKTYGQSVANRIIARAQSKYQRRPSDTELETIAAKYKAKVEELGGWPDLPSVEARK